MTPNERLVTFGANILLFRFPSDGSNYKTIEVQEYTVWRDMDGTLKAEVMFTADGDQQAPVLVTVGPDEAIDRDVIFAAMRRAVIGD